MLIFLLQLPAAWLSLFDIVFLIILIPLMDRVVYPALDRRGRPLSLRVRMLIGMVFSLLAVACAGGLEMWRLDVYWANNTQNIHWQYIGNHGLTVYFERVFVLSFHRQLMLATN
jgi:peptide/histidine transporter 3/4